MLTILKPARRHQPRRHAADIAEALNHHARVFRRQPELLQRFERHDHAAAPRRFRAPARSAQFHRLARHNGRGRMAARAWNRCP